MIVHSGNKESVTKRKKWQVAAKSKFYKVTKTQTQECYAPYINMLYSIMEYNTIGYKQSNAKKCNDLSNNSRNDNISEITRIIAIVVVVIVQ